VLGETNAGWRTTQREAARRRILDAAWVDAESHGVGAVSLRGLARNLGMTAPSLYSYFDSKDAIYDAMYAESWRGLGERTARAQPFHGSARDRLAASLRVYLEYCTESLARFELMSRRPVPGWEPSPEAYAEAVTVFQALIEFLASIGVTDPRHVDLYTAVASGLAAQQMSNQPTGDRWVRLGDDAADMLMSHFTRGENDR
jgi:AcrR family transcriptional regulator